MEDVATAAARETATNGGYRVGRVHGGLRESALSRWFESQPLSIKHILTYTQTVFTTHQLLLILLLVHSIVLLLLVFRQRSQLRALLEFTLQHPPKKGLGPTEFS